MRISLIENLLSEPLQPGKSILVEFDPTSVWHQASVTVAAEWLAQGGTVTYSVTSQPPDNIRSQLKNLGVDVARLEAHDKLRVFDWYTATLGRRSNEKYAFYSLKAADLSVLHSKYMMASAGSIDSLQPVPSPEWLRILDDTSCLERFNEEKSWVEFVRTRLIPISSLWTSTGIGGVIKGVHSEWVYKSLEATVDGVIDIKLDESAEEAKTMMRIRSMRNVRFDSRWHPLRIAANSGVSLER